MRGPPGFVHKDKAKVFRGLQPDKRTPDCRANEPFGRRKQEPADCVPYVLPGEPFPYFRREVCAIVGTFIIYPVKEPVDIHNNAFNMGNRSTRYISPVRFTFKDGAFASKLDPSRVKLKLATSSV